MIENICNEEIIPENDSNNLEILMNVPVKAISPQLVIDIEKSLVIGDILEKISEVDLNLEELESSLPSLAKELEINSHEDCLSPKSLSLNQLNRIKNSKCMNDGSHQTSRTIQLLSDFIELNPRISNRNAGLADLDPNYTPKLSGFPSNAIFKVVEELKQLVPLVAVDEVKAECPLLYNNLVKHVDPALNKITKSIESIMIKSIKELNDQGFIRLSAKSKNTIDGLVQEDIERLRPTELRLKQIPADF